MNESLVTLMYSSDDDNRIILTTNPNLDMCQREYVNANYVDVSFMPSHLYQYDYCRDTVVVRSL